MDSNLVIFSLEYTYLVNSHPGIFESNTGLWQNHSDWSRALIPYNVLDQHRPEEIRVIDNVSRLRRTVMTLNHNGMGNINHIKLVEPQLNNQLITISINGNETFVNNSRSEILKVFRSVGFKKLTLTPGELKAIGPDFAQRLNSLALRCEVEIMISDYESNFDGSYVKSNSIFVYILGDTDKLSLAQTNVRVLIDALLNGCFVDRLQVPSSMIPCVGGAGLTNITELTRESGVNVYLPDTSSSLSGQGQIQNSGEMSIWLTSKRIAELSLTKKMLLDLLSIVDPRTNATATIFDQEIDISKDKLDLLTLYHQPDVLSTMLKHGTYVQKSLDSAAHNQILLVQGQTAASVKDTAAELSSLSCRLYNLEILFPRGPSSADLEYYFITLMNYKKTCILTYNEHGMSILGSKKEIHLLLKDLVIDIKNNHFFAKVVSESDEGLQVALNMELANDQKDFLSGKKNGKIIKILNQLGHVPTIAFSRLNNFNFIIRSSVRVNPEIKSKQIFTAFDLLMRTMSLIELEYPAELQFNIPEVFHKSLIGNGGSIIQSIMKKYNVFIKFSRHGSESPFEDGSSGENILFSFKRRNNVLIKCPMKNSKNIGFVKYEIDQLVQQCCQNRTLAFNGLSVIYNTAKFSLLKSHYLLLTRKMNFNLQFVSNMESEFSTFIDFPSSIEAFDGRNNVIINIKGNDIKPRVCAERMAEFLPRSYEIEVTCSLNRFETTISPQSQTFKENIIIPCRLLLQTELVVEPSVRSNEFGLSHKIILSSYDVDGLTMALSELSQYLRENDLAILGKKELMFHPIVSIDEVASPTRQSPYKSSSRSPYKSPQKSPHKSPQRSPSKSPNKGGSPTKNKRPLGVITNQQKSQPLKSIPQLGHSEPSQVMF